MAIDPGVLGAGEPVRPARPLVVSRARTARRIVADRWASRLVVSGGIIIIASILAILFVIAAEVYPLFKKPTVEFLATRSPATATPPAPGVAAGVDEYREVGYTIGAAGVLELIGLKGERSLAGSADSRAGWRPGQHGGGAGQGAPSHRDLRRPGHRARHAVRRDLQGWEAGG